MFSELESSLGDKWKQIFSTVKNQGAKKAVQGYLKKKEWIGNAKTSSRLDWDEPFRRKLDDDDYWKTAYYYNHLYSSNQTS